MVDWKQFSYSLVALTALSFMAARVPGISNGRDRKSSLFILFVLTIYAWTDDKRLLPALLAATAVIGLLRNVEGYESSRSLVSQDFLELSKKSGYPVASTVRDFAFQDLNEGEPSSYVLFPSGTTVLSDRQKTLLSRGDPIARNTFSTVCPLDRSSGKGACGGTEYSGLSDPLLVI